MGALEDIAAQFPYLAWLINDPEVGNLLTLAVNTDTTFSSQRFEAELMNTSWWRNRSTTQRQWEILANTDPAEAAQQRITLMEQLLVMSEQMGVGITIDQARFMTEEALQEGLDINHPHLRQGLARLAAQGQATLRPGAVTTSARTVDNIARQDWFIDISGDEALDWATKIAAGNQTIDDFNANMQTRAMSTYSHLKDQLDAGNTMADIFGGHINMISNELEISPAEVDLTKGKWLQVMDMYDPNTQIRRPLTLSETRTLARQDDRFWNTTNGRAMDSQMTNNLLRTFGARR